MINEKSSLPGDLTKRQIKIDGKDISSAVLTASIYLDIVGGIWSCQLHIEDTTNLLTSLPIKSGKKVEVTVETRFDGSVGNGQKTFKFEVYDISNKTAPNHMQYNYVVHCASKAFIKDQKTRISQFFEGKPDKMIEQIASNNLDVKIKDKRKPEGSVQFIATNWSPLNTIAFISKWATYDGKADFLFFQTDNEEFDFMPIKAMYEDRNSGLTFKQRPFGIKQNHEFEDDPAILITKYNNDHFNATRAGLAGYFGSKNAVYDMVKKKWKVETYKNEGEGMEGEFKKFEDANISYSPKHNGLYDGEQNVYDNSNWIGSRRAALMTLDREKIFVQTAASAKCWEWLGKFCKIDLPSMEDMTSEEFDKDRRGKYLITAISMVLSRADSVTNYEMVKIKLGE